jgi:hypothetical protein
MGKEQVVETIKRGKRYKGQTVVKNCAQYKNGKLLVPIKHNGKMKMSTLEEVQPLIDKKKRQVKPKKKAPALFVEDLIEAFKGLLVTDVDKNSYTNFRYPETKKIIFYCIGRDFGLTVSTRNDATKTGWKSSRIITEEELKIFVASIKAQEQNHQKFETAFVPWYLCPECDYKTTSKTEMTEHIVTHGSEN